MPPTVSTVPPTTLLPSFFLAGVLRGADVAGEPAELAWRAVRRFAAGACAATGWAPPRGAGGLGSAGAFASGNRVGNATGSHVDGAAWPASSTEGEPGPEGSPWSGNVPDEVGGVNGAFIAAVSPKTEPAASNAPAAIAPRRRSGCRAGRVERISPTAGVCTAGSPAALRPSRRRSAETGIGAAPSSSTSGAGAQRRISSATVTTEPTPRTSTNTARNRTVTVYPMPRSASIGRVDHPNGRPPLVHEDRPLTRS